MVCAYEFKKFIDRKTNFFPLQFSNSFASMIEQNINGKDILWAATYGGLFKINLSSNQAEQFISEKKKSNGLLGNQIDQLLLDRSGVLWIATEKGVNYHSLKTQKFNNVYLKKLVTQCFKNFRTPTSSLL